MEDSKETSFEMDVSANKMTKDEWADNIKEHTYYALGDRIIFQIDDFDLRFYHGPKVRQKPGMWIFDINTYPINPREVIKLINHMM